jgi:hypothetical protein
MGFLATEHGNWIVTSLGRYRAPLHKECLQHHGHKENYEVTPGTCGTIGEKDQMILLWVRGSGV